MSKVVNLNGGDTPYTAERRETVVGVLRELLERAEAGDVQGLVVATIDAQACGQYWVAGVVGSYSLVGAANCAARLVEEIARGGEE